MIDTSNYFIIVKEVIHLFNDRLLKLFLSNNKNVIFKCLLKFVRSTGNIKY